MHRTSSKFWDDKRIDGGGDWRAEIDDALNRCAVCIFLVSRHSLSSRFILDVEMKRVLERHHAKGAHIYPIVISSCDIEAAEWLMKLNLKPRDGTALELYAEPQRNKVMADLAKEIRGILDRVSATPTHASSGGTVVPLTIDTDRLPNTPYKRLVGRDDVLARLDQAWQGNQTNVISLVAEGGAGKSALINEWLLRFQNDNYGGAEAVLGWSFYSQGSKERATSADQFLDWAIDKLCIANVSASASAKGDAIAKELAKRRILLILDGIEPLQHGPGLQLGQLKDHGLRVLLRRFAAAPPDLGHGLVVATSRLAVLDIDRWRSGAAQVIELNRLSAEAGAALLKDNAVWGTDKELARAVGEFGGQALALSLLASYLKDLHNGDVRKRDRIGELLADEEDPRHGHAKRVMLSYEQEWLVGKPILHTIMYLVGLFDRPASGECLKALRSPPSIQGLTDSIVGIDENKWWRSVARLRDARLLAPEHLSDPDSLDAHPLVREWFGSRLKTANENAWRTAHGRVYEHLRDNTHEGATPKLSGLAPLYQAIPHGCQAGRHQEALNHIFVDRLCRKDADGEIIFFSNRKLGLIGSNLAAMSWFFDTPFEKPIASLPDHDQSWLLMNAATFLTSLGRLDEGHSATNIPLTFYEKHEDWYHASGILEHIIEIELLKGNVSSAIAHGPRAVKLADKSVNKFAMVSGRSSYAFALNAAGQKEKARYLFCEAENIEQRRHRGFSILFSLRGYQYCDLLLEENAWGSVRDRAEKTLSNMTFGLSLLSQALDHLALGRALFGLSVTEVAAAPYDGEARKHARNSQHHLTEAIDKLLECGHLDHLPRGYLASAAFLRAIGDWEGAIRDLHEVEEIAELTPMRLFLCDLAVERARLAFAHIEAFAPLNGLLNDGPQRPALPDSETIERLKAKATENLAFARNTITECGYHRRDEELAELEAVLTGQRRFADLPPRV